MQSTAQNGDMDGWLHVQCDCAHATGAQVQALAERTEGIEARLCALTAAIDELRQQQQSVHDMVRHLYYEHNRNEVRKRNAAIRRKSPVRFMAEAPAALDESAVYHLLH